LIHLGRKTFYGWHVVAAVFVLATFGWGVVPLIVAISQGTYAFAPTVFGIIREFTQPGGTITSGATPYLFAAAGAIQGAAIAAFRLGRVRIGERKGKVAPEIDTSVLAETKLSER
jgi:hypothetical protein